MSTIRSTLQISQHWTELLYPEGSGFFQDGNVFIHRTWMVGLVCKSSNVMDLMVTRYHLWTPKEILVQRVSALQHHQHKNTNCRSILERRSWQLPRSSTSSRRTSGCQSQQSREDFAGVFTMDFPWDEDEDQIRIWFKKKNPKTIYSSETSSYGQVTQRSTCIIKIRKERLWRCLWSKVVPPHFTVWALSIFHLKAYYCY